MQTSRRSIGGALLACLLVCACGTDSVQTLRVPLPSPSAALTVLGSGSPVPGHAQAPGTYCDASAAFSGRTVAQPSPSPAVPSDPPSWHVQAAGSAVTSIAVSPDGGLLATAGSIDNGGQAQLWTVGGTRLAALRPAVVCLAWSPDGDILAGAYRTGEVSLWDRQGRLVRTLPGSDPVYSLAWSPDGTVLATGAIHFPASTATGLAALPGIVRVWSRDGTLARTLATQFTGGKFLNLQWSPDGSMLAAGAVDYRVWRADGTLVGVPRTSGTPAWAMAWSPDGRALAIGDENGSLQIARPDGSTVGFGSFDGDVNALSYSPDGSAIAVGHDSKVTLVQAGDARSVVWSVDSSAAYAEWSAGGLVLIATPDGLALIGPNGAISRLLDGCAGDVSAFSLAHGAVATAATDSGALCAWPIGGGS